MRAIEWPACPPPTLPSNAGLRRRSAAQARAVASRRGQWRHLVLPERTATASGAGSTRVTMTPIPSDPLKRPPAELTLGDGRKVKLKLPALDPAAQPSGTT